jgi:nifR3 family TIM-barrel protein
MDSLPVHDTYFVPTQKQKIYFCVGNIPIFGDLILAPMDGITDLPFRRLSKKLGSSISFCEFINAMDALYSHPHLEKKITFTNDERPVVYQIYDNEVERIIKAAIFLEKRNPDIIDINMGCPAKSVTRRGAGAGLLLNPQKIKDIFSRLSQTLHTPLSGKIRLGWDEKNQNYIEIAKIIEDNGGKLLAVHGRTKAQGYNGFANWDAIAEIKQNVSIPVLANGDVRTVKDIDLILGHTKCDGVMIGRSAIKNPWIFSRLDRVDVPPDVVYKTMIDHLQGMIEFYGAARGLIIFRKFVKYYLEPYELEHEPMLSLMTTIDIAQFTNSLQGIFQNLFPSLFLDENFIP